MPSLGSCASSIALEHMACLASQLSVPVCPFQLDNRAEHPRRMDVGEGKRQTPQPVSARRKKGKPSHITLVHHQPETVSLRTLFQY